MTVIDMGLAISITGAWMKGMTKEGKRVVGLDSINWMGAETESGEFANQSSLG